MADETPSCRCPNCGASRPCTDDDICNDIRMRRSEDQ